MFDYKNSEYFDALPKSVQESIMQAGADFDSEEELLEFVTKFENVIS